MKGFFSVQEEIEAQMKADKIKLALEKLKEAKVKKVSSTEEARRGRLGVAAATQTDTQPATTDPSTNLSCFSELSPFYLI